MPQTLLALCPTYDVTLETTSVGTGSNWDTDLIPVGFNIASISDINSAADGSGTNYWDTVSGITWMGNWITIPSGSIAASTAVYVTYKTSPTLMVTGAPVGDGRAVIGTVPTVLSPITAISDFTTPVSYEISGLTTGQTLAAEIKFDPPLNGVVITQIEVNTDGSDIDIGLYKGSETTGTGLNIKFKKENITTGEYNSSTEFPGLRVVIEDDAWSLGIVDTGVDATPAGTSVTVRGYPLI